MKITNKNIRWIFFAILSFLGIEMLLRGLQKSSVLNISLNIEVVASAIFAFIMISGLYIYTKRGVEKNAKGN